MGRSRARARAVCWLLVLAFLFTGAGEVVGAAAPRARAPSGLLAYEPSGGGVHREGPYLLLDIAFFDNIGLSERMKDLVFREVEESFRPLGVKVGWADRLREPERPRRTHEVRVLVVKVSPLDWGFEPDVMGTVLGRRRGAVYVFYPSVIRTLRRYRGMRLPERGATELGKESAHVARALARVVVHELIHTLTPGLEHSRGGIMQRNLDSYDLVMRPVSLDPEFRAALEQNLVEAIAEARGVSVEQVRSGLGPGR